MFAGILCGFQDNLVKYDGKYVITGTTKDNVVRVMEEGTYNIILKDLNIDVSEKKVRKY